MKRNQFFFLSVFTLLNLFAVQAQTDPGKTNLKHQWTFDNGSATDNVAGLTGTIVGTGSLINNSFVATNAYMDLPASQLALNTYTALTVEIWCTSAAGKNGGWSMLSYFGETVNGGGSNYTFLSIARYDNVSMAALGTSSYWDGCTGTEYDDGILHHFVYSIDAEKVILYIDGVKISEDALTAGNSLANLSTSLAYIGRGGWTGDPNWVGAFHKFSIYDKALSTDEVLYLYQHGAEDLSVISTTNTEIALDKNYPASIFNVTGSNLLSPINLTAPAGVMLLNTAGNKITSLPANSVSEPLVVAWDGTTQVNGDLLLTSGATVVKIPVKTADDAACFQPLNDPSENFFKDPGCNDMSYFEGWGSRAVCNIISAPTEVYCGASSIKVGNGTATGSGSLSIDLTGKILPNTTYKAKARVKTMDGTFQMGVYGYIAGAPDLNKTVSTNGEWQKMDFTFTTGASMNANQGIFFNNWQCTGTTGYIDNWELYLAPDPVMNASVTSIAFDPEYKVSKFLLGSSNLVADIQVILPSGLSVNKQTIAANTSADTVQVSWDGTTAVDGNIQLTSGDKTVMIPVKSVLTSNTACFSFLKNNSVNLVKDPYLNDMSNFGGWGTKKIISVIESPDSVYCGSHSGLIISSGSIDLPVVGILKPNTSYVSRAMVRTFGGTFQLGAFGIDSLSTTDITSVIETNGEWMPVTLEFTTSTLSANHGVFFNNYNLTGKRGFIDNWELYEVAPDALIPVTEGNKVFLSNDHLQLKLNLQQSEIIKVSVYTATGSLLNTEKFTGNGGFNLLSTEFRYSSGLYVVKIECGQQSMFSKIIK